MWLIVEMVSAYMIFPVCSWWCVYVCLIMSELYSICLIIGGRLMLARGVGMSVLNVLFWLRVCA